MTTSQVRRQLRSERAQVLVATALALGVLLAMGVVGVDLGRLALTATEVQTVADIAATAGAMALLNDDNPVSNAQHVVHRNLVDGKRATISGDDLELGHYSWESRAFMPGGSPTDAVRATAHATVTNLVAGIWGDFTTTVTKTATAAFSGTSSQTVSLPIVVGECHFSAFETSHACSDLPTLTQVPSLPDNSGWTSLSDDPARTSETKDYLPEKCGGEGLPPPAVQVGQLINVSGGQQASVLKIIDSCLKQGQDTYVIPIVPCPMYNQNMKVLGFATIVINSVKTTGKGQEGYKHISLSSICNAQAPGPPGGSDFGTSSVALVQ